MKIIPLGLYNLLFFKDENLEIGFAKKNNIGKVIKQRWYNQLAI